ncbi:MAG: flavin reductase family protein [Mycobacteriales bacterium]
MPIDPDELRRATAEFPTGVAVVTLHDEGDDIGLTSTSLRSVSLDPPLVLVTVLHTSYIDELFTRCPTWAVSALAGHQTAIGGRFAAAGRPSARLLLSGLAHHRGDVSGALVVDDGTLALECRTESQFAAGDHRVVVGRVMRVDYTSARPPLLRHRGGYRVATPPS